LTAVEGFVHYHNTAGRELPSVGKVMNDRNKYPSNLLAGEIAAADFPRPGILVVDDRIDNLIAAEDMLHDLDADIITATNAKEALALCTNRNVSLVILNAQMHGVESFQDGMLFSRIETTHEIPIILLTTSSDQGAVLLTAYQCGTLDYIIKPFTPEILISKVSVYLSLAQHRRVTATLTDLIKQLNLRNSLILDASIGRINGLLKVDTLADSIDWAC
jgi:PleD family two-component response regulator